MTARSYFVYRIYDADDALLYVGVTENVDRRLNEHRLYASFSAEIARATYEEILDRMEAYAAERAAIFNEQPRHNIRGKDALSIPTSRVGNVPPMPSTPMYDGPPILNRWAVIAFRESKYTPAFVASAAFISHAAYLDIEAGLVNPSPRVIALIAHCLDVYPMEIAFPWYDLESLEWERDAMEREATETLDNDAIFAIEMCS